MIEQIDIAGPFANRYLYNNEAPGFTYLAVDTDDIYELISAGVWQKRIIFEANFVEVGPPGEQGPQGPAGAAGNVLKIGAAGNYNSISNYNNEDVGFAFLAVDRDAIYILSAERVWEETTIFRTDFVEVGPQGEVGQTGLTGPQGEKGDTGDPGTGVFWKGAWNSSTEYGELDAVEYGGSSYVANAINTNNVPSTPGGPWDLWVSKGNTGATGAQGPQGIPGVSAGTPISAWTSVPSNVRFPGELLVKSSLDAKANLLHVHGSVSYSADGFMVVADKVKLDGIQSGAQVNVGTNLSQGTITGTTISLLSSTGSGTTLPAVTTSLAGLMSAADKTKLNGIASNANNYVHPTGNGYSHVPANISTDVGKVLVAGSDGVSYWDYVGGLPSPPPDVSAEGMTYHPIQSGQFYYYTKIQNTAIVNSYEGVGNTLIQANTGYYYIPVMDIYYRHEVVPASSDRPLLNSAWFPSYLSNAEIPAGYGADMFMGATADNINTTNGKPGANTNCGLAHVITCNGSAGDMAAVVHIISCKDGSYNGKSTSNLDRMESSGFTYYYKFETSAKVYSSVIEGEQYFESMASPTAGGILGLGSRGGFGWLHRIYVNESCVDKLPDYTFISLDNVYDTVKKYENWKGSHIIDAHGKWNTFIGSNPRISLNPLTLYTCGIDLSTNVNYGNNVPALRIPATSYIDLCGYFMNGTIQVPLSNKIYIKADVFYTTVTLPITNKTATKIFQGVKFFAEGTEVLSISNYSIYMRLLNGYYKDDSNPFGTPTNCMLSLGCSVDTSQDFICTPLYAVFNPKSSSTSYSTAISSTTSESTFPFVCRGQNMGIGYTPSVGYSLCAKERIWAAKEIISGNAGSIGENGYRIINGNYGVVLTNDGSNFKVLTTASGQQYNIPNALLPLTIQISTGNVTFGHAVAMNGSITISGISTFNGNIAANGFAAFYSGTYYGGTYASLYSAKDMVFANGYGMKVFDSSGNLIDAIKVTASNNVHVGINTYKSIYLGFNAGYSNGCPVVVRVKNENLRISYVESNGVKWLVGLTDLG